MNKKGLDEILVEESYQELLWLLKWFSNFGPIPIIIGGWAVFFYNSYYGSVDIDVVGPSRQGEFMGIIEQYERTHDYEFMPQDTLGLEVTPRKTIIKEGQIVGYIEIDACTFENPLPSGFHEDMSKNLPYSQTVEKGCQREVLLEDNSTCYVPSKPLLLLYKIKAARDRAYDLKTKGPIISPVKVEWLRGKLAKDRADILALLDPNPQRCIVEENLDAKIFQDLVRTLELEFCLTTLTELETYRNSMRLYSSSLKEDQVKEWVKRIM